MYTEAEQIKTGPQLTLRVVHYGVPVVLNIQGSIVLSALVCGAYLSELLLHDWLPVDLKPLPVCSCWSDNKYAVPSHELGLFRDKASFISLHKLIICFLLFWFLLKMICEFCNIITELTLCCPWGSS